MQVHNFIAQSNPRGARIDLSWVNPTLAEFPGFQRIRILRREFTEPVIVLEAGVIKIERPAVEIFNQPQTAGVTGQFSDVGLSGDTVYYYVIVAEGVANGQPALGPLVDASAFATTPWRSADDLYSSLPALYRRYDTVLPPDVVGLDTDDKAKGQLRRLFEMFGLQIDLLRSFARGMRDFSDIQRMDGELLPLRADWIGWPTDFTLPYAKQRNEIRYAPHYFRTTGIAANLQATLNRLTRTDWQPRIKEFVHNVFLSNAPEQLFIEEAERKTNNWPAPNQLVTNLVTLDHAFEGRPSVLRAADGRDWLVYHARQRAVRPPAPGGQFIFEDQWRIWLKIYDQGAWRPARRLTFEGDIHKYPVLARGSDGNLWLFYGSYGATSDHTAEIRLRLFDIGTDAKPARLQSTNLGPFNLADGDTFRLIIQNGAAQLDRIVTVHQEHFRDITQATAVELVSLFEKELPGVTVAMADDGTFVITTATAGATSVLTVPASPVATQLGALVVTLGTDAVGAQINGARNQPFPLVDQDTLLLTVDGQTSSQIVFEPSGFANINAATASEVAAAINRVLPGVARVNGLRLTLSSPSTGEQAFISVDVNGSTAAAKLGLGVPLPGNALAADDTEPAALTDNQNRIWLFWSSRRNGFWKIWFNRFDGTNWGVAKPLTTGAEADREPAVVFDPGAGGPNQGTLHVFWSRKKNGGLWNIFARTTSKLDFDTLSDPDWAEVELAPIPPDHDRREPFPILLGADNVELYFSSNQTNGWQVWLTTLNPAPAATPTQITSGQFTHRAPAAVRTPAGARLWFRCNESQTYDSPSYPGARTIDARYAGSTTADTRNPAKLGLRLDLQDVERYTFDTGRADADWYSRETVGIYLTPDTADPAVLSRKTTLLRNSLQNFLPIQVRAVLVMK